ncbi:MAG: sigma-70 family RNA polymerase sigma factor [Ruminococcus sp.]|nr:sigma-70 family RNA polymerase sigma factor [Ruminococcus sp.]
MVNSEAKLAGLTFEQAVRKYADTVTGVCIMRLQNAADAEDCFQNVFVKLYTKSPQFTSEEHLKAWLIRVAIRECSDYRRKNRRVLSLEQCREAGVDFDYDQSDMSWALSKTPPKYRDVLYLYYCERYTVGEIADILGKNRNTVKSLLKRGREKLKTIYGGEE